jgi:transcriptional regulator GlxA family with amidase domain
MRFAILIFDRITALDAVGPYEVLARLPDAEVSFVGLERGVVRTDNRSLGLAVDRSLDEVPATDVLLVPGGFGWRAMADEPRVIDWLRRVAATATIVSSVCTGSLLLAAAGLLDGIPATTHWHYMGELALRGAVPTTERIVEHGNVITAAGVSAGIDMALALAARLAGEDVARAIQLGIEYDPAPPFDAGSPAKAPPHIVAAVQARLDARNPRRA